MAGMFFNRVTGLFMATVVVVFATTSASNGENLYNGFIDPGFGSNGEFSQWDIFGNPSQAFVNVPAAPDNLAAPSNPPILTQTTPGAIVTSGGSGGWGDGGANIYNPGGSLSIVINDTTPFNTDTIVFQYQVSGSMIDLSQVRLKIGGVEYAANGELAEYIREYAGASSYGGIENRTAIQWDISGMNLSGNTTYQILFDTPDHTSLQVAVLDTSPQFSQAVSKAYTWNASGSSLGWATGGNWQQGSAPVDVGGNIKFSNSAPAAISLGTVDREVGELILTGQNVTVNSGRTLIVNTGISATNSSQLTINSNYRIGATNVMDVDTGSTVRINGAVSGGFGGLVKMGGGLLDLTNNNSFNRATSLDALSNVEVYDGTLRFGGSNLYAGVTTVLYGTLIVAADALNGSGALGVSTTNVNLGAGSSYAMDPDSIARIHIEGNRTMGRNISLSANTTQKTIGAISAPNGATVSGNISLGTTTASTSNVTFSAAAAGDRVNFTGNITGGSNSAAGTGMRSQVYIGGAGVVEFSGNAKTYFADTTVLAGAELRVNTILGNSSNTLLTLNGGTLSGAGIIKKNFTVDAGDVISPGNSVGRLTIGEAALSQTLTFGKGGTYRWEMSDADGAAGAGWDHLQIYGSLVMSADANERFTIELSTTAAAGFDAFQDIDWVIASATGGITGFQANAFQFDTSAFDAEILGHFSLLTQNNDLVLRYVHVVPEPGRAALLLVALSFAALRRRR
ncbi:PEP-CTERM sorting domain-containing protein [Phragmitibacter flavus]|uniref:PEP-CTERM sorting domain-containing protein n=1 Tax=Phragmitibacter flavus TaxID=2576071 RepID=A0A5R8KJV2_9BACT|nr:PEP-CTERM sorting domain-containing protein [Phragmitibacter flavus]TLD72603.1 PEP-CTERM sorting domain-containing protein [Phragmitibacter flavus]